MAIFKFIGQYTNGHTSISYGDVTWQGHDPAEVTDPAWIARLSRHPEFEEVHPLDHDGNGEKGGSLPKRKRRKPA